MTSLEKASGNKVNPEEEDSGSPNMTNQTFKSFCFRITLKIYKADFPRPKSACIRVRVLKARGGFPNCRNLESTRKKSVTVKNATTLGFLLLLRHGRDPTSETAQETRGGGDWFLVVVVGTTRLEAGCRRLQRSSFPTPGRG